MESSRTESARVATEEPVTIPLLTEFLFCGAAVAASLLLWRFLQNATFLLFYPVVTVAALRGGFLAGAATGGVTTAAGYLLLARANGGVGATPDPSVVILCLVFLASSLGVSAYAHRLHHAARVAAQQRDDSNEFAAKLHLQLMLAEAEAERLRAVLDAERERGPLTIIRPVLQESAPPAAVPAPVAAEPAPAGEAPPAGGTGAGGPGGM
jgi:hypothetical protein